MTNRFLLEAIDDLKKGRPLPKSNTTASGYKVETNIQHIHGDWRMVTLALIVGALAGFGGAISYLSHFRNLTVLSVEEFGGLKLIRESMGWDWTSKFTIEDLRRRLALKPEIVDFAAKVDALPNSNSNGLWSHPNIGKFEAVRILAEFIGSLDDSMQATAKIAALEYEAQALSDLNRLFESWPKNKDARSKIIDVLHSDRARSALLNIATMDAERQRDVLDLITKVSNNSSALNVAKVASQTPLWSLEAFRFWTENNRSIKEGACLNTFVIQGRPVCTINIWHQDWR
jgi:hypothetical protein